MMDGTKGDAVLLPIPCGERDGITMGIAADVANDAATRRAIDMHAIASVTVQRESINSEVADVTEMHRKGATLPHGDMAHRCMADVVQQDHTVRAGHGILLRR